MGGFDTVEILIGFIGIIMVIFAFVAVTLKNVTGAVITSGAVGLMASLVFLLLDSPDVAMTEATIGSGLTTVIFLYAIKKTSKEKLKDD